MLSSLAGRKQFLYDHVSNTIHDLSKETENCHINSLDKKECSVCDSENQVKEIAISMGRISINKCPYCFKK